MSEGRWKSYIKDYESATMMQCEIVKDIDYENISDILQMQKEAIIAKIH